MWLLGWGAGGGRGGGQADGRGPGPLTEFGLHQKCDGRPGESIRQSVWTGGWWGVLEPGAPPGGDLGPPGRTRGRGAEMGLPGATGGLEVECEEN